MRRPRIFWPALLVIAGVLLLLNNLGILAINFWALIWPVALILLGVSFLIGTFGRSGAGESRALAIPLEGAEQARVRVQYGAGRLNIHSGAMSGELLSGNFEGGVDHRARRDGALLDARLSAQSPFPWDWPGGRREWDFGLNGGIPLALEVEMGAAEANLNLADLRVTDFKLETGASSTHVTLPAKAGHTTAKIEAGAASVAIGVPPAVAARIRSESGLASVKVDADRFPHVGNAWQSPDYESAPNRVEISIEVGMGEVTIR